MLSVTKATCRVLAHGIPFANGLCLSHDRTSVLFVSTARATVFRYWVKGPQAGLMQILCNKLLFVQNLFDKLACQRFRITSNEGQEIHTG